MTCPYTYLFESTLIPVLLAILLAAHFVYFLVTCLRYLFGKATGHRERGTCFVITLAFYALHGIIWGVGVAGQVLLVEVLALLALCVCAIGIGFAAGVVVVTYLILWNVAAFIGEFFFGVNLWKYEPFSRLQAHRREKAGWYKDRYNYRNVPRKF